MRTKITHFILVALFLIFNIGCSTRQNKETRCPDFSKSTEKNDIPAKVKKAEVARSSSQRLASENRSRNVKAVEQMFSAVTVAGVQKPVAKEEDLYALWNKEPQVFTVYQEKDTTLICEQGTRITIPKGALTFANGKPATYPIRIEVKEYYRMEDFFLANLTTACDGRMLESGGMLLIEAKSDGQKLKVKNKETVKIEMPASVKKSDMELFYGSHERNQLNWKPARRKLNSRSRFATPNYYTVYSISQFVNPVVETIERKDLREKSPLDAMSDTVSVEFDIDQNGTITNIKSYKGKAELTRATVGFMKWKWTFGLYLGSHWRGIFYPRNKINFGNDLEIRVGSIRQGRSNGMPMSSISLSVERDELQKIKMKARNGIVRVRITEAYVCVSKKMADQAMEKELEKMKKEGTLESNQGAMSYYVFDLNNLGWINCDRFYEIPKEQKIAYRVNNHGAKDVKIIFNDIQSIMPGISHGSETYFENVPVNTPVTIVAIRKVEGGFEVGTKKTLISDQAEDLEFEKVASADALREKIKMLMQ